MSKISYCSLEEAWGSSINKKEDIQDTNKKSKEIIKNKKNDEDTDNINIYKTKSQMDFETLKKDNENMKKMLNTMNYIERNKMPENNINEDYNDYRFNPVNKVNSLYSNSDINSNREYKPFHEDIEKKSLQNKFIELENDFRKYKMLMNKNTNSENEEDSIESFSNFNNNNVNNKTDIQDLIVLIILGLIIIFIMDNIFKLGKYLGSKNN
jgi:hypothetical protein